jgi:transposase
MGLRVEDLAVVLHLLTKRREDLVGMRTQTINGLHRLLVDLVPAGAGRNLTAKRAAALLAQLAPAGAPAVTRWQLAVLAAKLLGEVGDIRRFPSKHHFPAHTGTARWKPQAARRYPVATPG